MGTYFILSISIILVSGFVAGWVCKYFKISPLIGYLLVGAVIGPGGFDLTGSKALQQELDSAQKVARLESQTKGYSAPSPSPELSETQAEDDVEAFGGDALENVANDVAQESVAQAEQAAPIVSVEGVDEIDEEALLDAREGKFAMEAATEFGVLLLLFAIGIEFTFDKLAATAKYMFVGGLLQMGLTIGLIVVVCALFHMPWVAGLAIGSVVALSSTALVYRSMEDLGQADSKRAQATLGLLIFQDVALVPLLLILPRVLGAETGSDADLWVANPWVDMTIKSFVFCAIVLGLKFANVRVVIPGLATMQSNDLVILYAIIVLLGMCVVAGALGLTPALGALAAGVALGENRLTYQIDALVMPFREAFSALFFISLGMLTDFSYVFAHPIVCLTTFVGAVFFKAVCATIALKACGMDFRGALAYGTSVAQIGELAFMILAVAYEAHAIKDSAYHTMLFVSVASLVVTPNLVKIALTKFGMKPEEELETKSDEVDPAVQKAINEASGHVVVVGAGHIGKSVADELIALGASVCVIDFNPVNLHPFNQRGIPTLTGDGANQDLLREAGIHHADAIFVTVPRDDLAINVVKAARDMNPTIPIATRARYKLNVSNMRRSGANLILCEEERIADELVELLKIRSQAIAEARAAQAANVA